MNRFSVFRQHAVLKESSRTLNGRRDFFHNGFARVEGFPAPFNMPVVGQRRAEWSSDDKWFDLRQQYELQEGVFQLDHGYWGVMARPVMEAYLGHLRRINLEGPVFGRLSFPREIEEVRQKMANFLGVDSDEIYFTRGATEALQILIRGYRTLRPGDEVMYSDHDYDSMQDCMDLLKDRRGVKVVRINLPSQPSWDNIIETYEKALDDHPKLRLLLLTHLCHRNGLVLPVKEISAMARARGVEVIVDAAHSLGQKDLSISDLGANFVGLSLHKWIGAPVGVGLIYIRRGSVEHIEPSKEFLFEDDLKIDSRVHTGNANFAAFLTVSAALEFLQGISISEREKRLRVLQKIWTSEFRGDPRVEILIPEDPRLCAGMASFRLKNCCDLSQNKRVAQRLWEHSRILTVPRDGLASGACIRVTPACYTKPEEIKVFISALKSIIQEKS